jgi:hypothetical protein
MGVPFLTSAIVASEKSASQPGRFIPGTHWIRGWVEPRVGLDDLEKRKIVHCREFNPCRPDRPIQHNANHSTLSPYNISLTYFAHNRIVSCI